MADCLSKVQRSYNMSRIRSTGTKPEMRLLDLLHELFPYERIIVNPKDLPGKPDAWIPDLNIVIFADGCFFHNCPTHGHIPKSNKEYWIVKLKRNKLRDLKINRQLQDLGLKPVRIWEHQLDKDLREAKRKLRQAETLIIKKMLEQYPLVWD